MRDELLFDDDNFQLLCYCNLSCLVHGGSCAKFMLGFGDNINNASDLVVARVTMVSSNISTPACPAHQSNNFSLRPRRSKADRRQTTLFYQFSL